MPSEPSWTSIIRTVAIGVVLVSIGRLVLYTALSGGSPVHGASVLGALNGLAWVTYWNGAVPVIAIGLAVAAIAKRPDPLPFILGAFGVEVISGVAFSLRSPPIASLSHLGSTVFVGYDLTTAALALGAGVWLSRRHGVATWLSFALLLALTQLPLWFFDTLMLVRIGELGLLDLAGWLAPVALPVAALTITAWFFRSRLPERLGGGEVRGWMALPLTIGLDWCSQIPQRLHQVLPVSQTTDQVFLLVHHWMLPSVTIVSTALAVWLASHWRSERAEPLPRLPRVAAAYLAIWTLGVAYHLWVYSTAHVLEDVWSGGDLFSLW